MAYTSCKAIIDEFLADIRAYATTSSGELHTSSVRKGPIHTLRLGSGITCGVVVSLEGLDGGEQSAGTGNHWWHDWTLNVLLIVPDNESDPGAAEDIRCELLDDFMAFVHSDRCLVGGVKKGFVSGATFSMASLSAEEQQVWRAVECKVTYKALV